MKWRFLFLINFLVIGIVVLIIIGALIYRYFPSAIEKLTQREGPDERRFVTLDSVPPGALLTIDGRKMNFKTPARLSFSGDKSHEVIFELAGYPPCTVSTNTVSSSYVCKFKK